MTALHYGKTLIPPLIWKCAIPLQRLSMKRIVLRAELSVCLSQKITGMCQNKRPKNAKNSVLETLKIKNFLGGACPQTPLGGSRLRRSPCPPQLKQPGDATVPSIKYLFLVTMKMTLFYAK